MNGCVKKATFAQKQNKQKNMIPRKIWITNAIIISCKTKETLYNIFKRKPTSESVKKEYRDYCKIYISLLKMPNTNSTSIHLKNVATILDNYGI